MSPANRATCTWCGHRPHPETCPGRIQTGTPKKPNLIPCPCTKNRKEQLR